MDAFFAAIEEMDNPNLRGKPVVIGAPPDQRGVVSTASYEARKYGIHSAMPSRTAGKLCPHAIFLPPRFKRYEQISGQVMKVVETFTPVIEQVSVDEAFMDVRGALRRWKDSEKLARALKEKIRSQVGLTASVGVAPNKFLAKLSSDLQKPDGLTVVPEDEKEIARFLAPLPITKIWGVGKKTAARLESFGLRTIRDVQSSTLRHLSSVLGATWAEHVFDLAFGRDDRPVMTEYEAKSISSEHTFDEDCSDADLVRQTMIEQAEHVGERLRRSEKKARVGHIKVRFEDFRTITRQLSFPRAVASDRALMDCALGLLEKEKIAAPVRLLGFGVSGFDGGNDTGQLYLFQEKADARDERVDAAVDHLREKFGREIIRRGVQSAP
jgi:nucleotidyltransferase/DNA polymerase involved in DNA repair